MISKNKIKFLKSLHQQKYRKLNQMYLVEGHKSVVEWLKYPEWIEEVFVTEEWANNNEDLMTSKNLFTICRKEHLKQFTQFQTIPDTILLSKMPAVPTQLKGAEMYDLCLVVDRVQDPGNLGTIIRTADWFGVKQVVLLKGTVDAYNAKVVQATMGSLLRVKLLEMTEEAFLKEYKAEGYEMAVADMEGIPLNSFESSVPLMLVLGNEGQGVSKRLQASATYTLSIPGKGSAESLNVGIAGAIFMYALNQ